MKNPVCSPSMFLLDVAFVIALFCISNGCTKIPEDNTSPSGPPPIAKYNVSISDGFNPSILTVKAGTVVTWANNDNPAQSVTSDDGLFDGIVTTNGTYTYKFESAGIYTYHSRMNQFMVGEVDVN